MWRETTDLSRPKSITQLHLGQPYGFIFELQPKAVTPARYDSGGFIFNPKSYFFHKFFK